VEGEVFLDAVIVFFIIFIFILFLPVWRGKSFSTQSLRGAPEKYEYRAFRVLPCETTKTCVCVCVCVRACVS
jgi:hypothetical protein